MNFELRKATPEDQVFLRSLFLSIRDEMLGGLPLPPDQKDALLDMQYRARNQQYRAVYPLAEEFLLLCEGQAVGAIYLERGATRWSLADISILAPYRGKGLGTWALERILNEANGTPVQLMVEASNPARRLYSRLGFRELGNDGLYVEMSTNRHDS